MDESERNSLTTFDRAARAEVDVGPSRRLRTLSPMQFVPGRAGAAIIAAMDFSTRVRWLFAMGLSAVLATAAVASFKRPGIGLVVNLLGMLGPLLGLWWAVRPDSATETCARGRKAGARGTFICLTAGLGLLTLGQICLFANRLLGPEQPYVSWVDCISFAAYPCLIFGILLLPLRRQSMLARGRAMTESALSITALATLTWFFVLGPILLFRSGTTAERAVALGYAVADMMVLFSLLLTCTLADEIKIRPVAVPLMIGAMLAAVTDIIFAWQVMQGVCQPATAMTVIWPVAYMLFGIAAASARKIERDDPADASPVDPLPITGDTTLDSAAEDPLTPAWRSVTPYLLIGFVGIVFVYARLHRTDGRLTSGVDLGTALITIFVLVRQLLEWKECRRLYRRVRQAYEHLGRGHRSLARANASLEEANTVLRSRDQLLRGVADAANCLLTVSDFQEAVAAALRAVGHAAEVHRVYLFELRKEREPGTIRAIKRHDWRQDDPSMPSPGFDFPLSSLPRWQAELTAGRSVWTPMRHLPDEELAVLKYLRACSILCVPVHVSSDIWGFIGFEDHAGPREWDDAEVSILSTLATAIAGAQARSQTEAELQHDSLHDALTGLPNRLLFADRVNHCISRSKRNADYRFAVLFLDLDRFKVINDSLGHAVGDKLLMATSERLARCVRGGDSVSLISTSVTSSIAAPAAASPATGESNEVVKSPGDGVTNPSDSNAAAPFRGEGSVARLGGDEFTILLDELADPQDAVKVARRILAELSKPFVLDGHEVFTTASIGIVNHGPENPAHATAEDLLRDADAAMYRAKTGGKARYAVFDASMHKAAMARLTLESELRRAIERDELQLYYQPIICLDTGRLIGFEALLRWLRDGVIVGPGEFIPVAEDTGLIVPIGEWVIERACRQLAEWRSRSTAALGLSMSVNLSRRQLGDLRLVPNLQRVLEETKIGPASLRLEITESSIMDDAEAAGAVLARIKSLGVELSMDDFGTGYSSLSCLHNFPIDLLKLDRGFLNNSSDQREVAAVVQAIVSLAHNLGMKVVAEGLEKIEQVAFVQALECDFGQGYIFAKPLNAEAAEAFLRLPLTLARSA